MEGKCRAAAYTIPGHFDLKKITILREEDSRNLFKIPRQHIAACRVVVDAAGRSDVARKDLTLKAMYEVMGAGEHGDEVTQVRGVIGRDPERPDVEIPLKTRFHIWKIQPSGLGRIDAEDAEFAHFMELRDGPDGAFYRAYDAIEAAREFERSGEAASTWTSVNNCTGVLNCPGFRGGPLV